MRLNIFKGLAIWLLGSLLVWAVLSPGLTNAQNDLLGAWQASYWNNVALSGAPDYVRNEATINHNWGNGAPNPAISADRFSARWEGTLDLPAGQYRFTTTADDGVRVWVNGRLIIDEWRAQAASSYSAEVVTDGSDVSVMVDYFENTGLAQIDLAWERLDDFGGRWQGEYFNNLNLEGTPALLRPDTTIDFQWGSGSPAPDIIDPETFSARWTRTLELTPGQYRFILTVDDGARLWVNEELLIDAWQIQGETVYRREIDISDSTVPVRLEYFENGGQAVIEFSWARVHGLLEPGAGTLIDNGSAGFVAGGPDDNWQFEGEGYGDDLLWTQNNDDVSGEYNWARWYPSLTAGTYEVEAYIPFRFSTTAQARYWISHADGYQLRTVDQSTNGDRWVSLGTYSFEGTGSDFVSLADVTFEPEGSRLVAFDAVRWTPVSGEATTAVLIPNVVGPGTQVTVRGEGFPPGSMVALSLGPPASEPIATYDQAIVSDDGSVLFSLIMPARWPNGTLIQDELPPGNEIVALLLAEDGISATANFTYTP